MNGRSIEYIHGMNKICLVFVLFYWLSSAHAQEVALLKYEGGGDWYANPTALENLVDFYNEHQGGNIELAPKEITVDQLQEKAPAFVHATGHGRIYFSLEQAAAVRQYLQRGGFLHLDDNYGMKEFAIEAMRAVFPDIEPVDLPGSHPVYHDPFAMPDGIPKIHEHDGEKPRALGYFYEGELVALITMESDLGDGWEDPEVHNDSPEKREIALKMGANLVHWSMLRNSSNP